MAMVVKNNISAMRTLGELNRNSTALSKSLKQVSTGMKINSAADDNSGYSIAERMVVRVRSLDQADQNTQNGSNMLKVAEGAVSSTVDILRTMKEKAIDAANDTNTDEDRAVIQKELDQFIDQIDDNAMITYNGKTLVDGSKMAKGIATRTALTNASLSKDTTGTTALVNLQNRNGENLNILTTDKLTVSYVIQGKNYTKEMDINASKTLNDVLAEAVEPYSRDSDNPQARAAYNTYNTSVDTANADYSTATSTATSTYNSTVDSATTTYNQAVVDANGSITTYQGNHTLSEAMSLATANKSTYGALYERSSTKLAAADSSTDPLDIIEWSTNVITFSNMLSEATSAYNTFSTQLSNLLSTATSTRDNTISTATADRDAAISTATSTLISAITAAVEALNSDLEAIGDLIPYKLTMDSGNELGQDAAGETVYTADMENALTITAAAAGEKFQLAGLTFSVTDSNGQVKKSVNAVLDNFTESIRAVNASEDNALTFQVDAKANQSIRVGLTDMRSGALGLKGVEGNTLSLATQEKANAAINVLENAIKKAIDQQTDIGSIVNRLGQTSSNLHIARDNVQAAESTIRDADMAKAMTEYTKNNILLQASQSMLAQANQSSSSVLGLLQ